MPRAMTVRQAISDGRVSQRAAVIAADTASTSWPSTSATCQPATRKRCATSSLIDRSVLPSSVMRLSSQNSTSLPSRRCPAKAIISWPTPSCRQPSPTKA